jgi:uncharacterized membrane protein YoaK (UPF0700 family)
MTRHQRRLIIRQRRTMTGLTLVAAISFIAGMTDAVGLILSGDFVSFMSGNTTRAALSFADGNYGHAFILFVALWVFILGNTLGIVIAHKVAARRTFAVLTGVAILLAAAAGVPEGNRFAQFYIVVLSMGLINATVEHIEGLPIGLTYVTGALSRFGRGIGRYLVGDRNPKGWLIQCVPWTGMAAGAIIGAVMTHYVGHHALWVVSVLTLAVALVAVRLPRSLQRHFHQPIVHGARRKL